MRFPECEKGNLACERGTGSHKHTVCVNFGRQLHPNFNKWLRESLELIIKWVDTRNMSEVENQNPAETTPIDLPRHTTGGNSNAGLFMTSDRGHMELTTPDPVRGFEWLERDSGVEEMEARMGRIQRAHTDISHNITELHQSTTSRIDE